METMNSETLSSVFIGSDSLLIECAEIWRSKGHQIEAVVTDAPRVASWAKALGLTVLPAADDYAAALTGRSFDYLFAITFLRIIPKPVLALPSRGAINFHDGPLPRYAGLNAPAWALIHRERDYGITWHLMTADIDAGDVLKQLTLQINADETSLSLNTRCFALAIESFGALTDELAAGSALRTPQTKEGHSYFGRFARPSAASVIDWEAPAASIAALIRALDFGPRYPNTLGAATLIAGGTPLLAAAAEAMPEQSGEAPGTVVSIEGDSFSVACGEGVLQVRRLRDLAGMDVSIEAGLARLGLSLGSKLDLLAPEAREQLTQLDQALARGETFWVKRLRELDPEEFPYASAPGVSAHAPDGALKRPNDGAAIAYREQRLAVPEAFASAFPGENSLAVAFALYAARLNGHDRIALACADRQLVEELAPFSNLIATTVPLLVESEPNDGFRDVVARFEGELKSLRTRKPYLRNVGARFPELTGTAVMQDPGLLPIGVALGTAQPAGSVLGLSVGVDGAQLRYAPGRLSDELAARVARELSDFLVNLATSEGRPVQQVDLLSKAAAEQQLAGWNDTVRPLPEHATIHGLFEAQVDRTPDAVAVACEDASLTYRQLDEAANRLAAHLRTLGVAADTLVGVHVERSIELVVATLGVLKAGGAYVPLDPAYPSDRVALMIADSGLKVVVTQASLLAGLGGRSVQTVALDSQAAELAQLSPARPAPAAGPANLAYVIYTSGSTGTPKGVMIEHRQAVNFFAGMDERVPFDAKNQRDVWLAVTSLSFDISVLELFWTLSHGFKVVVHTDRARAAAGKSRHAAGARPLDYSLFYFSADANAEGSERYRLLLEGARFADEHDFSAVWTPERHFHAFGGLYPNPAVTGAAVAAITKRVGIRAGSVVLPLHHPVRVAEAWSIVDNISNGRVGVSMASGWQPNDFILMPGNYKNAKRVMMENIEVVRKLWRGETLTFPGPNGEDVPVRIMPEPVQKELPVWITTAGNAETFEMAGAAGAHVLTHLLGQTIEKLAPKIAAYRKARARAGFDPNTGMVSLMLHTFVGPTREDAREIVRGPLKAYLATSMDLIKDKAWVFPAFQRPKGVDPNSPIGGNELAELSPEDRDGLLEAAFERYFETSGLFGTVEDAYQMSQQLKQIGVDEIACLVDFGVPTQLVLDHLPFLDQVRAREQSTPASAESAARPSFDEHPLLTDVRTHAVTHMQCTPSMARMFLGNEETRSALAQIQHLFLGGEALPADLLGELRQHSRIHDGSRAEARAPTITNMYGPTETTVWSTTHKLGEGEVNVPIGRPIANTSLYITDSKRRPLPAGVAGELFIGGLGVARGYFQRPELTEERFVPDPFSLLPGARMYRTGDRARWRQDGVMEFLGRADFQVKVRGYRIEPGEIEALVRQTPGVNECVVMLREDRPGDQRLVAYVVPAPRTKIDAQGIRDTLRARLPEYMVPAHVLAIDELPLTPNRKIDRKALPAPDAGGHTAALESAKPESEIDKQIAEVWQEMLGREGVGVDDNFFDLGGHSLLVVRVHRKLQEVLGRSLALTDLYRFPTIRALSSYLTAGSAGDSRKGSERGARRRELMQQRRGR
jgi:natural product biosynthesis luciferase-like monooxygenase protein